MHAIHPRKSDACNSSDAIGASSEHHRNTHCGVEYALRAGRKGMFPYDLRATGNPSEDSGNPSEDYPRFVTCAQEIHRRTIRVSNQQQPQVRRLRINLRRLQYALTFEYALRAGRKGMFLYDLRATGNPTTGNACKKNCIRAKQG